MTTQQQERTVHEGLKVGSVVRFKKWSPGRGRQEFEGEIIEVDPDGVIPLGEYAFTQYKIEHETGWAWTTARKVTNVLKNA